MKRLWLAGVILLLLSSVAAARETEAEREFSPGLKSYLAELDRWSATARIIKDQPAQAAALRKALPGSWPVSIHGQPFAVSTHWLEEDLKTIQDKPAEAAAISAEIQERLAQMRAEAEAFETEPGADPVRARTQLTKVLHRAEFHQVHKPGWLEEMRERVSAWLNNLFERFLGGFGNHPEFGRVLLWFLVAFLVAVLLLMLARSFFRVRKETLLDLKGPVHAARGWKDWAREALAMAGRGNYREAIHLGYWAGIYRLEESGVWQAHQSRTHREYLRLLKQDDGRRPPLAALTSRFEIVWYGGTPADAEDFEFVVRQLEGLGCSIGLRRATGIS